MAYTTINKSTDYFNTKLYTGNGGTQSITGVGFQPDFTWIKNRSATENHFLQDVVRGSTKRLNSNNSNAEATEADGVTAFASDGFNLGYTTEVNGNGNNICSWNWKANGAGSANTDGSINSTVSANTTSGFSIVSYTGNGTAGATIGHGLGTAPKVVLCKRRSTTGQWIMGHGSLGFNKFLELDLTGGAQTHSGRFNDTAPTSSVFTVGTTTDTNQNGTTIIAYCFAEKTGYSKFGSYVGNGNADGPFIHTGFAPSWILIKKTDTAEDWFMVDNKREPINPLGVKFITANNETAEQTSSNKYIDFLSNGFKLRAGTGYHNDSPDPYVYMAFAEAPLVGSNNIPCTAR